MFSKKPLGNMFCASCDEQINIQGNKAEYLEWNKFPGSSPSPMKMAELGVGQSKMLKASKGDNSDKILTLPSVNKEIDMSDITSKMHSETVGCITKTWRKTDDEIAMERYTQNQKNNKTNAQSRLGFNRDSTNDES